jgi:hypothetical protein
MMLTDEQKSQADKLGLTYMEMAVAIKTRIPPETYAERKRELLAERDEWEAKMEQVDGFFKMAERNARHEEDDA